MLPRTIDGMKHVCYFRHALALDERRVKFTPEYVYGGGTKPSTKLEDKKTSTSDKASAPPAEDEDVAEPSEVREEQGKFTRKCPHTMEVWFAGTHSDM